MFGWYVYGGPTASPYWKKTRVMASFGGTLSQLRLHSWHHFPILGGRWLIWIFSWFRSLAGKSFNKAVPNETNKQTLRHGEVTPCNWWELCGTQHGPGPSDRKRWLFANAWKVWLFFHVTLAQVFFWGNLKASFELKKKHMLHVWDIYLQVA